MVRATDRQKTFLGKTGVFIVFLLFVRSFVLGALLGFSKKRPGRVPLHHLRRVSFRVPFFWGLGHWGYI